MIRVVELQHLYCRKTQLNTQNGPLRAADLLFHDEDGCYDAGFERIKKFLLIFKINFKSFCGCCTFDVICIK